MSLLKVYPSNSFECEITDIASDKSISHRCSIFSLLSDKPSVIRNYLRAEDTMATLNIVSLLGAKVEDNKESIVITPPLHVREPSEILDCGNSGTAIRLLMGFLSAQKGFFVLSGDKYLNSRPMKRVSNPLRSIGAQIDGREDGEYAPLAIRGNSNLKAFDYDSKIASAQVKTALILSALKSNGICKYNEPELSRNHSENMLKAMGAKIDTKDNKITIQPLKTPLEPLNITVPNDPSSGFFFAVAAAIKKGSKVILKNMLLNDTRIEAYRVLANMGAKVEFIEQDSKYEKIGDIIIEGDELKGVEVSQNISWLIDELPALSIAFACAKGKSIVKNAKELRVKESDRISTVVEGLKKCGIECEEFEDGYKVVGGDLKSAKINSYGDHRIAMSFSIAGMASGMEIEDIGCISTSFPNFIDLLSEFTKIEERR